jgi:hypothetical protein
LGFAAAPVPSITVTFLSNVLSAQADPGMPIASSAATMAPNFKPCMFHSPNDVRVARALLVLYGRLPGKKTAKSYAALRHETAREPAKNNAAFQPEGGTVRLAG